MPVDRPPWEPWTPRLRGASPAGILHERCHSPSPRQSALCVRLHREEAPHPAWPGRWCSRLLSVDANLCPLSNKITANNRFSEQHESYLPTVQPKGGLGTS